MEEKFSVKIKKEDFIGESKGKLLESYDVVKQLGKGGYGKE